MVCTFARVCASVTVKVKDDFMQGDLEPAAVNGNLRHRWDSALCHADHEDSDLPISSSRADNSLE
jgi:hypothetical protein